MSGDAADVVVARRHKAAMSDLIECVAVQLQRFADSGYASQMNRLSLTYNAEDEWHGELAANLPVHAAGQAAQFLEEVTEECRARRKLHIVDVAV
ncbi:hypothetical protein [Rhizobium sp. LjRoot258]|uniref:hypothetical protein n=1 Tax=Rhizobium sp. LjRoot258 TaxID=3342299 RepID=UPI003F501714